jgi:hypothetical protein
MVNITAMGHTTSKTFCNINFSNPWDAKDSKKTTVKEEPFDISKTKFIYKQKSHHHK